MPADMPAVANEQPLDAPPRLRRWAVGVLAVMLAAASLWTLHEFLKAIAWATVLAIVLWPACVRLRAQLRGHGQVLAPALLTLALALLVLLPLGLLGVKAGAEVRDCYVWARTAWEVGVPVSDFIHHLPMIGETVADWWSAHLVEPGAASRMAQGVQGGALINYGRVAGAWLLHELTMFAFTLLTLFFLLRDGDALAAQLRRAGTRAFGPHGERVGVMMMRAVRGVVAGLVLVGLGEGVLIGIVYAVSGVPHAIVFGAVTAVACMLPLVSALPILAAGATLLFASSTVWAIVVVAFGFCVTFVADHFVRPAFIGGATRLPFVLRGIALGNPLIFDVVLARFGRDRF
jgi:predicted PurR-regulated permease PerM